jgi:hypothetical protein
MDDQREWKLGAHVLRFEPPDVLWAEFRGETSVAEAVSLVELYRKLGTSRPFFLVLDVANAATLGQEARRYISENAETEWVLGVIYVKARLALKAVARGIFLAAWMTGRADKSELAKVHFVSSHAEASELMARLRAQRFGKVA